MPADGCAVHRQALKGNVESRDYRIGWLPGLVRGAGVIFGDEEVSPVGSEEKLPPEWAIRGLSFDHDRMVATVRALEVPILFINYPYSYGGVRRAISSSGERLGIPVIDSLVSLKRARVDGHSTRALIVRAAGPHPRGLLYGYIVEDLILHIVDVMETWHGADLS